MALGPVGASRGAAAELGSGEGARSAPGAFGRVIDQMLGSANRQQVQADQAIQDLSLGKTDNLHSVMLAVAQADLSLRMIVEVRNRLTEAFQEVMRMQI